MLLWQAVAGPAHPAFGAPCKELQGLIIHAAEQVDMGIVASKRVEMVDAPARFLDGAEIPAPSNPVQELDIHHGSGAAGIVVEHDRQARRPVDRERMIGQLQLRWNGVKRRTNQYSIEFEVAGDERVVDALLSSDRSDAGYQRNPAFDCRCRQLQQPNTLVAGLRIIFTGRAADDDAMNTCTDQVLHHRQEAVAIDRAILVQWRNDRRDDAFEGHGGNSAAATRDGPLEATEKEVPGQSK